jgi:phosphoglycolate phosphatase-like HAD superfamily hydrolase
MTLDTGRIQAICFDVDGTLHDTDDQFVLKLAGWLQKVRFLLPTRIDPLVLARKIVMSTETPANILYGIPDRLGIDQGIAEFNDWLYRKGLGKSAQPFQLIDGVQDMLIQLYDHYPMSVVSARGARSTNLFLKHFGIRDLFVSIATAQTCRHAKPYPDPIIWASQQMNVPPKNCLMIGDTTVDIIAGKAAGTQTAGVLCGFGTEDELVHNGADIILASTAQLMNILLEN